MTSLNASEFVAACRAAIGESGDMKPLSAAVPHIIEQADTESACNLAIWVSDDPEKRNSSLPEMLALCATPGLNANQKAFLNERIFSQPLPSDPSLNGALSDCNARIGRYGFSFPQWRYITQKFDGPSLIEHYGMRRLERDTDILDAALQDPARDRFGPGFVWSDDTWYVEYRRAYIIVANRSKENPAALLIRNNSYFFGRDRLPAPAYVSWKRLSDKQLQGLTEGDLSNPELFSRWQESMDSISSLSPAEKSRRAKGLLDYLDNFDAALSMWLQPNKNLAARKFSGLGEKDGFKPFLAFLKHKAASPGGGPPGSPFMAVIDSRMPPWFPKLTLPLTPELVAQMEKYGANEKTENGQLEKLFEIARQQGLKLVLLTGKNGDFPIIRKPDIKITSVKGPENRGPL
jgi:hypothetical protein